MHMYGHSCMHYIVSSWLLSPVYAASRRGAQGNLRQSTSATKAKQAPSLLLDISTHIHPSNRPYGSS